MFIVPGLKMILGPVVVACTYDNTNGQPESVTITNTGNRPVTVRLALADDSLEASIVVPTGVRTLTIPPPLKKKIDMHRYSGSAEKEDDDDLAGENPTQWSLRLTD